MRSLCVRINCLVWHSCFVWTSLKCFVFSLYFFCRRIVKVEISLLNFFLKIYLTSRILQNTYFIHFSSYSNIGINDQILFPSIYIVSITLLFFQITTLAFVCWKIYNVSLIEIRRIYYMAYFKLFFINLNYFKCSFMRKWNFSHYFIIQVIYRIYVAAECISIFAQPVALHSYQKLFSTYFSRTKNSFKCASRSHRSKKMNEWINLKFCDCFCCC